eukprot:Blabericola_migrator_1__13505@NODE_982_length_5815_cov_128_877871_g679_i0_p1_GENE_NODE_982_length_5815_cov_128_877871_g679_i0NODE_982_length_5815_cov_128_877871_g679_i0_p1_ORF_typecomplete_len936_score202_56TruD/PF01142_18/1_8e57TruD/PF01142_18/1_1e31DNApol_Exo/PF18136_1/0_17DLIC/PF05783_11/0_44DLIC/PF05783_11/1_7e03_NODE_982_length_5815_cov_128_877871_g679_i09963803
MTLLDVKHGCLQCVLRKDVGAHGTIKNLWEDFHVREIRRDGTICQLDELVCTNEVRKARFDQVLLESGKENLSPSLCFTEEQRSQLQNRAHLNDKDIECLQQFLQTMALYHLESIVTTEKKEEVKQDDASQDETQTDSVTPTTEAPEPDTRDDDEIAKYGVSTEVIRRNLRKSHCLLMGNINLNATKEDIKKQRKELHDALREILPYIVSDTLATGDAYELQYGRDGKGVVAPNWVEMTHLDAETREALKLKRVFVPSELRTEFQKVKVDDTLFPHVDPSDLPSNVKEMADGSDRFRFVRIQLRAAAITWLLGRSLESPGLSRINWAVDTRWPKGQPHHLHFIMQKSNKDTSEAISKMAQCIGCRPKCFGFAGTKDRRGVTVQQVSVHKVAVEQLKQSMAKKDWDRQIRCSSFQYKHHRLTLGQLAGNHFKLVIRDIPLEDIDRIPSLCQGLAERGFINYFGLQRFGTGPVKTWQVGAALLAGEYESAVRLILGDLELRDKLFGVVAGQANGDAKDGKIPITHNCETSEVASEPQTVKAEEAPSDMAETPEDNTILEEVVKRKAEGNIEEPPTKLRKLETDESNFRSVDWYLKKGDPHRALRDLPRWAHNEKRILESLCKEPRSFIPALLTLTAASLSLYYHSAQSIVYNAMASLRVERFGSDKVVVGDLVRVKEIVPQDPFIEGEEEKDGVKDEDEPEGALLEEAAVERVAYEVCEITNEEEAAKYTVYDVVLPLPGEEILYPSNMVDAYEDACQQILHVSLKNFTSDKHGVCHVSGFYRPVIQKPEHVTYRTLKPGEYDNISFPRRPLLASDADRLLGKEIATIDTFTEFLKPLTCIIKEPLNENYHPRVSEEPTDTCCLLLSCSLPKSSYLTSAIREILEGDFSSKGPLTGRKDYGPIPYKPRDDRPAFRDNRGRGGRGGRGKGRGGRRGRH